MVERRTRVNLHDICVSDSPVIRTVRGVRKVSYFFANVYRVPTGELTGPLAVHISGWSGFYGRGCTSAHPYVSPTIRNISEGTMEAFENILECYTRDSTLVLKGFSADSSAWLEYFFWEPRVRVLTG